MRLALGIFLMYLAITFLVVLIMVVPVAALKWATDPAQNTRDAGCIMRAKPQAPSKLL